MGNQAEEFTGKLVKDKEIKSHLKVRSNQSTFKTVDKRLLADYAGTEWSVYKTKKKSVILKKKKSFSVMFEDRVWTILAKMGFTVINDYGLRLPYVDDESIPGKQIDAFAADNETIIIVECKSAETMKRQHFSKELNEYEKVISGGNKVLKKVFSDKHKIRYIFATDNIILSDNDRIRLNELQMFHFNQDDIKYYEELLNSIGTAGKYQLLARLFKGIDIPAFENRIPAIRGKMGGYNYYSFSIEPEKLLKISYILHRINVNNDDRGYQRLVKRKRLKEIEEFINEGGYFPNSIIININTKKDNPLNFDRINSPNHDSSVTDPVILHLPKRFHSAFIIDGQHRLYGYANSKYRFTNSIPVVAFENLPAEKQVDLFVAINSKQKPVSKNLLTTICSELMWNSEKYDEALNALMSKLLATLGEKDNSPLYGRIVLGDKAKTTNTCITLDTVIVYGLKRSNYFAKLNKKKLVETGHLWCDPNKEDGTFDYTRMLEKSLLFFRTYFDHIKENNETIWNLGNAPGGFITMNIGIVCFMRIASDILDYIKKYEGEDFSTKNGKDIAELTFHYIEPIFQYISTLTPHKIDQFRKYGSNPSGVESGVREFQQIIHNKFKEFDPEGLQNWINDNSGKFTDIVKTAAEKFEIGIKNKVYKGLEEKYGETWWNDGVTKEIRIEAVTNKIEQDSDEPDYEFLLLIHYKKIISRNWEIFKSTFADPGIKSNKDEQLKWFDKLNSFRNTTAHVRKIKASDCDFIKCLNDWLPDKLGISKLDIPA